MDFQRYIEKAKDNKFRLWLLNQILFRLIPFNKPHKFTVVRIDEEAVEIRLPYKKKNLNHIKGLHACAMATLAEYSTGFMMLTQLDPKKYRIIMKRIEMDYHYQGKTDATCHFLLDKSIIENEIVKPLEQKDSIIFTARPEIYDSQKNHLATGTVHWQVKLWEKVQTKM